MELAQKEINLVQDILSIKDSPKMMLRFNLHDERIEAYIPPKMAIVSDSIEPKELVPEQHIPLYSLKNNFYYGEFNGLELDYRFAIEVSVDALKMFKQNEGLHKRAEDNNFKKYTDQLAQTLHDKNSDYGDSFSKGMKRYHMTYVTSRLFDKLNRIDELSSKDDQLVKDESLIDTVKDLAGYAVLLWRYLEDQKLNLDK